jgi:NLR family CARD domain-containing protein 3
LDDNSINNEGVAILSEALKQNVSLKKLVLSNNTIGEAGAMLLVNALAEFNTILTSLDLKDNYEGLLDISPNVHDAIFPITIANESGTRLLRTGTELDLSAKYLHSLDVWQSAKDLASNTVLKKLSLQKNCIDNRGAANFAQALMTNRTLVSIRLDHNWIGDEGCLAMAKALTENNVLTTLALNGNKIGPTGAVALAEALCINSGLQELRLRWNKICDSGAIGFANALDSNSTLRLLELDDNNISSEGARAMLKTLKEYNVKLTRLYLEDNADVEPILRETIDFMLSSRLVLNSFLEYFPKPVVKSWIPLMVVVAQRISMHNKKPKLANYRKMAAGPVFCLVRAVALNDSKVVEDATLSCKQAAM